MMNHILSMFEYAATDEPATIKVLRNEEVDGVIKMCMKCTRFIEREYKISWNSISLNVPSQSG